MMLVEDFYNSLASDDLASAFLLELSKWVGGSGTIPVSGLMDYHYDSDVLDMCLNYALESTDDIQTLSDVLPLSLNDFLVEYEDSEAAKYLDVKVVYEHGINGDYTSWEGAHKNVVVWWELANGKKVGFNENPSIGWSFPVIGKLK